MAYKERKEIKMNINQNYCEVLPAYGRDYKTGKEAKADFLAGKDFILSSMVQGYPLCSIRDFSKGLTIILRYKKQTQTAAIKV